MTVEIVKPLSWITYQVSLTGITELLGGMPKTEDLIAGQMASKEVRLRAKATGRDPERIVAANMVAMGLEAGVEEQMDEEKMSCGFRKHRGQLCLGSHQIPSLLLDCATTSRLSRTRPGLVDLLNRMVIEHTIAWAHSSGLLNDAKFAQLWVNDQVRRPRGARQLRWELKNKGVSEEDIDNALSKAELDERELIRGLVEKRLALYRGQPWESQQRKLATYLAHRGFAMQDIAAVLKELKRVFPAH